MFRLIEPPTEQEALEDLLHGVCVGILKRKHGKRLLAELETVLQNGEGTLSLRTRQICQQLARQVFKRQPPQLQEALSHKYPDIFGQSI